MKKNSLLVLTISITMLIFVILLVHTSFFHPIVTYTIAFIVASLIFCWFCWSIFQLNLTKTTIFVCLGLALLIRLSFLITMPLGSGDVYRYMWDGKVQANGLNPYLYAPDSDALNHLHSSLLPAFVNHPDMKTLYFPFSQWIFYLCYHLSGEAIWGYKLLLILTEIATIMGLSLLLMRLEIPAKFVLFYALCPLPIFQFAIDSHLDGIGLPFLIFGLLFYFRGKTVLPFILFGLSISIKPVGLVLLPILFLSEHSWKRRIQIILYPLLTIVVQFIPYLFNSNPFESLSTFIKHWTFNGIVFEAFYHFFANNQNARLTCAILLMIVLALLYMSKKQFLDKIHFSVLLLLLFSPVVHPWYIVWLTVLLPLTQRWSGILYSATASLTSLTLLDYKLHGVWKQSPLVLCIEYLPVILFLLYELRTSQVVQKLK